jgi:hypothetical protein
MWTVSWRKRSRQLSFHPRFHNGVSSWYRNVFESGAIPRPEAPFVRSVCAGAPVFLGSVAGADRRQERPCAGRRDSGHGRPRLDMECALFGAREKFYPAEATESIEERRADASQFGWNSGAGREARPAAREGARAPQIRTSGSLAICSRNHLNAECGMRNAECGKRIPSAGRRRGQPRRSRSPPKRKCDRGPA